MKKYLLFILLGICSFQACKTTKISTDEKVVDIKKDVEEVVYKGFEGTIKYKFMMDNPAGKSESEINEMILKSEGMLGSHVTYHFKSNKMVSSMEGMLNFKQYYFGGDSIYMVEDGSDKVNSAPADEGWNYSYNNIKMTESAKEINGVMCDLMEFESEDLSWKYYFNKDYVANASNYKKYKSGFWNIAIEQTGCLPLGFVGKIPGSYMYMMADQIIDTPPSDEIFKLP